MMVSIIDLYTVLANLLVMCGVEACLIVIIWRQRKENRELERRNQGQAHTLLHVTNQLMAAERKADEESKR